MDLERTDLSTEELLFLWAVRETGALDALVEDADDPAEVADRVGITDDAAELVVEALHEQGFLARVNGSYEPTNRMLGFLASADLRSVGKLPDALDAVDALVRLPETMETGEPPRSGRQTHRLGADAALDSSTVRAIVSAAIGDGPEGGTVGDGPEGGTVLDVGGAPGIVSKAFAARGFDVTLADHPEAIRAATPLLAPTGVETVPISDDEPLPTGFDLVFATDVTPKHDFEENRVLVERMADALAPDGTLVLVEKTCDRSDGGVQAAIRALARHGTRVYETTTFETWFEAAGLGTPEIRGVPGADRVAFVARR